MHRDDDQTRAAGKAEVVVATANVHEVETATSQRANNCLAADAWE
jgi:hypothetical protein